jgi:Ca2+-dependent lipid-binding protein
VFIVDGKEKYRSAVVNKNLNPRWNENFTLFVSDLAKPIVIKVFDYDKFFMNDLIGQATLHVSTLALNKYVKLL